MDFQTLKRTHPPKNTNFLRIRYYRSPPSNILLFSNSHTISRFRFEQITARQKSGASAAEVSVQASALADLEARITSLGGLLGGFSSGSSPSKSRRSLSPDVSPRSPSISPMLSVEKNDRSLLSRGKSDREEAYDFTRFDNLGDPGDRVRVSSHSRGSSSAAAASHSTVSAAVERPSPVGDSCSSASGAASVEDLARQVEALLQSAGTGDDEGRSTAASGSNGVGSQYTRFGLDSNSGGIGVGRGSISGAAAAAGVVVAHSYASPPTADDGSMGSGWEALEGMAERLGALVGEGDRASVYSSSRGVASVSSPGNITGGFVGFSGGSVVF